jgi:predicted permease
MLGAPMALDARVLVISAAVSLITSVVFGIVPALQLARVDVRPMLGDGASRSIAGNQTRWPRHLVIVTQIALSVTIVFGAGLLVRTLRSLTRLEPGFDATNVVAAGLSLQDVRYRTSERVNQLFERTLEEITAAPGVEHAAVALTLPYERALNDNFGFVGNTAQNLINLTYVTTEYFDALRIPVRRGRVFTAADARTSEPVIVVNQAFARRYVPSGNPLGLQMQFSGRPAARIVGVVGDVQQAAGWGDYGPIAAIPAAYIPAPQVSDAAFALLHTWFSPSWIVRTAGPQQGLTLHLQQAMRAVDPQLAFNEFRTLDDVRAGAMGMQRLQAVLLTTLSALALLMAAIGIYGLVAGDIADRTRDLGIRMALGATPLETARSAMRPGVVLGAAGVAIGLMLARSLATTMRSMVFGVSVADTLTFVWTGLVVLLVAWSAAAVPSLRIIRLNITTALRSH